MALISINKLVELTGKARKTLVRRLSNVKPVEKKELHTIMILSSYSI